MDEPVLLRERLVFECPVAGEWRCRTAWTAARRGFAETINILRKEQPGGADLLRGESALIYELAKARGRQTGALRSFAEAEYSIEYVARHRAILAGRGER
jgi:hypothetical protein